MSFEKNLKRLEEIVEEMENSELSLDKSLKHFEEGVKLSKDCNKELESAEQKVQMLVGKSSQGDMRTEDFKG
ncbi:MAG: exodeoxyribonuclease VII small subunit [Bdellovibrionales bacterium]